MASAARTIAACQRDNLPVQYHDTYDAAYLAQAIKSALIYIDSGCPELAEKPLREALSMTGNN